MDACRLGLVPLRGSGGLLKARRILRTMGLPVVAVADLDFAFQHGLSAALVSEPDEVLARAEAIFRRLASKESRLCLASNGLPQGEKGKMKVAAAYRLFARESDGHEIAVGLHNQLLKHDIWIWTTGTVEDHLGVEGKNEDAWFAFQEKLATNDASAVIKDYAGVERLVGWLAASPPPAARQSTPG